MEIYQLSPVQTHLTANSRLGKASTIDGWSQGRGHMQQGHASTPKFEQMKLLGKIKPKGHWLEILKESVFKILFS